MITTAGDMTFDQTVSKTAVMEKVHKITEDIPEQKVIEKKRVEFLYIEADEDHIHRQKDEKEGCIYGKLIYLFDGKEEICKGRNTFPEAFSSRISSI